MPSGPRIRANNVFGTLDSAHTAGTTTLTSAGLVNLPAVSSAHALIVIDPLRTAGAPELVIVTAHTGSAGTATVTRGAGGTVARSHAAGVLWLHAPTIEDYIRIVTASTRPSDPYEGQLVYETDTDSYKGHNGTAWEHALKLGAWSTYTPTLTASTTNPTLGTGSLQLGRYRIGAQRLVNGWAKLKFGSSGTAFGSGNYRIGLPVLGRTPATNETSMIGHGYAFDASAFTPHLLFLMQDPFAPADVAQLLVPTSTIVANPTSPFTWANGDEFVVQFSYEAAA